MKVKAVQTSFVGGEIGPELYGRFDLPFYPNSVKTAINCHSVVQGGIVAAPGTEYLIDTFVQTDENRLIPFVHDSQNAYLLELSNVGIRVFKDGTYLWGSSLPSGLSGDSSKIAYTQQDNFLIMWRTDGQGIFRFNRVIDDGVTFVFSITPFVFQVPPIDEVGETRFNTTFTLTGTTLASGAAAFQNNDVDRQVQFYDGLLLVTGFTSNTSVTVSVLTAPSVTSISASSTDFILLDSPQGKVTPSGDTTVGGTVTLTAIGNTWKDTAQMTHVGMFVEINDGFVEIAAVSSATVATGICRKTLSSAAAAFAGGWRIMQPIIATTYAATPGPGKIVDNFKAACSFESRLVFGGTNRFPNRLCMSVSGQYSSFATGENDADAISRDLDGYDQILHLVPSNRLYVFTYDSEYAVAGSDNGPVTPLSIVARAYTAYGAQEGVSPVRVGKDVVMVQRIGQRIRGYSYQFSNDDFEAPDFTIRHPTITESGVVRLAYSDAPYQVMWMLLGDGTCALMCVDRASGTYAWSRFETDGLIHDITSVPEATGDAIYMIVERTIDGVATFMIERADYAYNTHCGIKTTGAPSDTWAAAHLEGETVDVLADDVPMNQVTVTAGNITLPRDAEAVEIGLPFTSTITLLPIEFSLQDGSIMGSKAQLSAVMLRLVRTRGLLVNGEQVVYRQLDEPILDEPIAPFTGDKTVPQMGWEDNQKEITITRNQPLPFHIAAIKRTIQVN